jgi:hypothetical protein
VLNGESREKEKLLISNDSFGNLDLGEYD